MKRLLKRTYEFCALHAQLRNPSVAARIHAAEGLPFDFSRSNGHVVLRDTMVHVTPENAEFMARCSSALRGLAERGARWRELGENKFEVEVNGLLFEVTSAEDVFVLSEVFHYGVYETTFPREAIVIDIGANIGASSLFFAAKPWVKKIYSFEPLQPTADLARKNFQRNPRCSQKIELHPFGLSDSDQVLSVEYSPEWKGKSGREELPRNLRRTMKSWKEEITLKNVSATFEAIFALAGQPALVVKMDCEGGEWKILPELARSGWLRKVDQLMFEWHDQSPEPLEKVLVENGFSIIRRNDQGNTTLGVIYGFRVR